MFKTFLRLSGALLLGAAAVQAQTEFSPTANPPALANPRLVATAVPNSSHGYLGMGFLSDGRMVVLSFGTTTITAANLGGGDIVAASPNFAVYLASGLKAKGDMTNVTFTKILDGLTGPPPGLVVVNDTIYVQDRTAFYRINSLTPAGTSKAENATRIISVPGLDSTFTWNRGPSGHQYIFTPVYHKGRFYAPYSGSIRRPAASGAPPTNTYTGAMLSWDKNTIVPEPAAGSIAGFTKEAGGLRSPNGMGGNGVFMLHSDNQGSFTPGSPIRLFKPGQPLMTYGHRQATLANRGGAPLSDLNPNQTNSEAAANTLRNWAEDLPYMPPVVWIPHGTFASVTQPVFLDRGPYKGHWIVGDATRQGIGRLFVDDVDSLGRYQASFTLFSGAATTQVGSTSNKAINRAAWSPDSALYLGSIYGPGNWPSGAPGPAIRLTFKDTSIFEILTVRSRKSVSGDTNGVEVFFSEPVDPATVTNSMFTLRQFNYSMGANYGCNSVACQEKAVTVTGVTLSADGRKAFVGIATPDTSIGAAHFGVYGTGNNTPGLWGGAGDQDRVLRVILGTGLRSTSGKSLFYTTAHMGWNYQAAKRFNPADTNSTPASVGQIKASRLAAAISIRPAAGMLSVDVELPGRFTVGVYTVNGALKLQQTGSAGSFRFETGSMSRGVHILRVREMDGTVHSRPFML